MSRFNLSFLVLLISFIAAVPGYSQQSGASNLVAKFTAEGQSAYLAQNYIAAEKAYLEAAKLAAKSPKALVVILSNLGSVYRESKQYEKAEATFKRALGISAQSNIVDDGAVFAMKQYGVLLRRAGKNFEADEIEQCAAKKAFPQSVAALGPAGHPQRRTPTKRNVPSIDAAIPNDEGALVQFADKDDPANSNITNSTGKRRATVEELKKIIAENEFDIRPWRSLAATQYKAKDYAGAASTLKSIVGRFPEDLDAPVLLAQALAKQGKDNEAIDALQIAIKKQPDDPDLYLFQRGLYARSGQFQHQIDTTRQFIQQFPDHPETPALQQDLERVTQDYETLKASGHKVNMEYRWPRGMMPLKVYAPNREQEVSFAASKVESDLTEENSQDLIRRAFNEWTQATGGLVKFVYVTDPKLCSIHCVWTTDASVLHSSTAVGETYIKKEEDGMPRATVKLLVVEQDGSPTTKEEFYETCLHEIGHALGLPHSLNPEDVMFPTANSTKILTTLSHGDRERILKMYTQQDNTIER